MNDTHYLTLRNGQLVDYTNGSDVPTVIVTQTALDALFEGPTAVEAASSLWRPERYTTDAGVLALVASLEDWFHPHA